MITIMIMGTGIIMIMGRHTEESVKAKNQKLEIRNHKFEIGLDSQSDWNSKLRTRNSKLNLNPLPFE